MSKRPLIVLTGGPGGGKSSLIEDMRGDPVWRDGFVVLPETAHFARFANIPPQEKLFQRLMVHLQIALEDGLDKALGPADPRPIICHRGSLDPLAFWLHRGWVKEEFFQFVGLSLQEHYQRYTIVIHLVTSADGVSGEYTRWPDAHRPETTDDAILLDGFLQEVWCNHPKYFRLSNAGCDWATKSREARLLLVGILGRPFECDGSNERAQ